jgi:hypothetical protein
VKDKEEFKGVFIRKQYFELTGNTVLSALLSRIHYWHMPVEKGPNKGKSRLRIRDKNKPSEYWVVCSISQWAHDSCITFKQAEKALAKLREMGLIETEIHKFRGVNTLHLRFLIPVSNVPINETQFFKDLAKKTTELALLQTS